LYKQKKFDEAIEFYNKAIEAQPNDLTYYNNLAAVLVEKGEFDQALEKLNKVMETRYEMNGKCPDGASFEKVGKVYVRMANIYKRQKIWDKAVEMVEKALCEDNCANARNAQRDIEKTKKEAEAAAYEDPVKAEEAKNAGNECFKAGNSVDAKKHYDEAVKRAPRDHKLYSNRAAALMKLMAYDEAKKDLEKCIKIDPTFIKAYIRMGDVYCALKDYNTAVKHYNTGLEQPSCTDAEKQTLNQCLQKVERLVMSNSSGEVDQRQVDEAMKDPEIQNILKDPQINMILQNAQTDPQSLNQAMAKDPKVAQAINKLMMAGIIRTG